MLHPSFWGVTGYNWGGQSYSLRGEGWYKLTSEKLILGPGWHCSHSPSCSGCSWVGSSHSTTLTNAYSSFRIAWNYLPMHHGNLWLHADHLLLKLVILCFGIRQPLFVLLATNYNHHQMAVALNITSAAPGHIPQSTPCANCHLQCSSNVNLLTG